jgi:hypothetical protein
LRKNKKESIHDDRIWMCLKNVFHAVRARQIRFMNKIAVIFKDIFSDKNMRRKNTGEKVIELNEREDTEMERKKL